MRPKTVHPLRTEKNFQLEIWISMPDTLLTVVTHDSECYIYTTILEGEIGEVDMQAISYQ